MNVDFSIAIATGIASIVWHTLAGFFQQYIPVGLRDILSVGNQDLWFTFFNSAFIGFIGSLTYRKVVRGFNLAGVITL